MYTFELTSPKVSISLRLPMQKKGFSLFSQGIVWVSSLVCPGKLFKNCLTNFRGNCLNFWLFIKKGVHGLMHGKAIKYKLRSILSQLILMHLQYVFKANILMPQKQLSISQEKLLEMYINLRKKKAGLLERFFLVSIGHYQYRLKAWKSHWF